MGEKDPTKIEVTPEMIEAGVAVFEELSGSFSPYGLVEQVYIAMRSKEASGLRPERPSAY